MPGDAEGGALVLSEVAASAEPAARTRSIPYVSLGIIAVFVLLALLAPLLRLADPHDQSLRNRFKPPVWEEGGAGSMRSGLTDSVATCSRASSGARACRWPRGW